MAKGAVIEGWFDGVCEPKNPGGHAASGVLVKVNGEIRYSNGTYIAGGPKASNNVAEYAACAEVMVYIRGLDLPGIVTIRGDSRLVIEQLNGRWKINGGLYMPYHEAAKAAYKQLQRYYGIRNVHLQWIPRDENSECDVSSKKVLLDRGIVFRIQPEAP